MTRNILATVFILIGITFLSNWLVPEPVLEPASCKDCYFTFSQLNDSTIILKFPSGRMDTVAFNTHGDAGSIYIEDDSSAVQNCIPDSTEPRKIYSPK